MGFRGRRLASVKESLFIEVGVGAMAYFCHAMREDYAVLRVCERGFFDNRCDCFEMFASHKVLFSFLFFYTYYRIYSWKSQEEFIFFSFFFLGLGTFSYRVWMWLNRSGLRLCCMFSWTYRGQCWFFSCAGRLAWCSLLSLPWVDPPMFWPSAKSIALNARPLRES